MPSDSNAALFVLTVRPQSNIAVESRLIDLSEEATLSFLDENLTLFHVMCEEDHEYQVTDLMTNGKIFN